MRSKFFLFLTLFSLALNGFALAEEVEDVELLLQELEQAIAMDDQEITLEKVEIFIKEDKRAESSLYDQVLVVNSEPSVQEVVSEKTSVAAQPVDATPAIQSEQLPNLSMNPAVAQTVVSSENAEEKKTEDKIAENTFVEKKNEQVGQQENTKPLEEKSPQALRDKSVLLKQRQMQRRAMKKAQNVQAPAAQVNVVQPPKASAAAPATPVRNVEPQGKESVVQAPALDAKKEAIPKLKPHFAGSKAPSSGSSHKSSHKIPMRIRRESKAIPQAALPKKEEVAPAMVVASETKKFAAVSKKEPVAVQYHPASFGNRLTADNTPGIMAPSKKSDDESQIQKYPRTGFKGKNSSVYFTGEWLFWKTRQGGMEYAVARSSNTPGVFTDAVTQKVEFDWESGFRAGLGIHLPHDGWDLFVDYTRFCVDHIAQAGGSLFPLLAFQGQFPAADVSHAEAQWKISFQTLDLEIGRAYFLSKTLSLRPHIGLKGAWIDQDAHVHYSGGAISSGQVYRLKFDNDFKGGGVRAGIDSNWLFGGGFSLFGNLSTALLAGFFDLEHTQVQIADTKVIDLDSDLHQISPMLQLILGAAFDRNFQNGRYHFGLSAGFESQYWWQQNQLEHFTDDTQPIFVRQNEPLSFYGLTLQARFDF